MKGEKQAMRDALETISRLATFNGMLNDEMAALETAAKLGMAGRIADDALAFATIEKSSKVQKGGPPRDG